MKFKTFRALVIVGGLALGVGLVALFVSGEREQIAEYEANRGEPPQTKHRGVVQKKDLKMSPRSESMIDRVAEMKRRKLAEAGASPTAGGATPPDAAPTPAPANTEGEPMRALDGRILERVQANISGDKEKDAFRNEAWKVNIYKDAGEQQPNRLKIDYDRDEKWDEKWSFEREGTHTEVKRFVAPADDENYTVEYRMRAGRWVKTTK